MFEKEEIGALEMQEPNTISQTIFHATATFFQLTDTAENLLIKAYAVVCISFAGREAEVFNIDLLQQSGTHGDERRRIKMGDQAR